MIGLYVKYVLSNCPCGLMDKALPSGGRDCGFESRLGLFAAVNKVTLHKISFFHQTITPHHFTHKQKKAPRPGIEPGFPA